MNNFREWLSDNLRYIMLIGGILILLLLIFFGIRAVSGMVNSGDVQGEQTDDGSDVTATAGPTDTLTPTEAADPLEKNVYPEVNILIQSYYEALGNRDVVTLKTLVDNFDPSDEAKIENAQYIDGYENVEVYTKKGMTEDSYIVLAAFDYICSGIETPVPALSRLYVVKNGSEYKISQDAENDTEIQNYVAEALQDADVQKLISDTTAANQKAQEQDPDLKEFLENLGKESTPTPIPTETPVETPIEESQSDVPMVTASTAVFVRSGPGGGSEVIGSLEEGEQIEKTGEDGYWIQVNYYGQTAYVFSEYVY